MKKYDINSEFVVITGPTGIIHNIEKDISDNCSNVKIDITGDNDGKYSQIYINDAFIVDVGNHKLKYPELECFICEGDPDSSSNVSYAGPFQETFYTDNIYKDLNGKLEKSFMPDWEVVLFQGETSKKTLSIEIKDGTKHDFPINSNIDILTTMNSLKHVGITIGFLANTCCPYVANNRKKDFIDYFIKIVPTTKDISKIYLSSSTKSRKVLDTVAGKLEDVSLVYPVKTFAIINVDRIYDFTTNTVTETTTTSLNLLKEGKDYEITLIDKGKPVVENIIGIDESHNAEFSFGKKGKNAIANVCLSNEAEIVVPEKDPSTGNTVTEIGSGCFNNCSLTRKIVIPATVMTFDEGCFEGAKKLTDILFMGKESTSNEYCIIDGNILKTYVSLKTEYVLPAEIHTIGNNAFVACPKLTKITLHKNSEIMDDSLCGCKSLKTIALAKDVKEINIKALEKASIKEIELSDGTIIKLIDKYMYSCIDLDNGISFSYEKAANQIKKASSESNKYRIAVDLLERHTESVKSDISLLMDIAIRYCIGKGDLAGVSKLLDLNLECALDYSDLVELANRMKRTDIAALLLSKCGSTKKKNILKKEIPAENGPKIFIKVRFEDNKAYSYFCKFNVKPGDKVFVAGKKAGEPGEVIEILNTFPVGTAAKYTLDVEKAFNVETMELGEMSDLDELSNLL